MSMLRLRQRQCRFPRPDTMRECDVMRSDTHITAEVIWIKMLINTGKHALLQIKFLS